MNPKDTIQAREIFKSFMHEPLNRAAEIETADIVVGVPFYNEVDTVGEVIKTVYAGLEEYYPDQKCVIAAVGSRAGRKALEVIDALPQSSEIERIAFLLDDDKLNGKGWSIRAFLELTRVLGADLAIIEADLRSREYNGV